MAKLRVAAANARTATVFHVANEFDPDYRTLVSTGPKTESGYPVRREVTVPIHHLHPLLDVLSARTTYFPPGDAWTCIFEPRHVLRVGSGEAVTVVICVHCGDVEFIVEGSSIGTRSVVPAANGQLETLLRSLIGPIDAT